jgi:hypothetical protein
MHPNLGEVLYWAACWIAAIVALLGLAAWITDNHASWIGAATFAAVAVTIWILGRLALWLSAFKQWRARRRS